jgi:glycosyltransferase involved in cell wall biosynthesis
MRRAAAMIFSTEWQKGVFEKVYGLDRRKDFIVRNFCGKRQEPLPAEGRAFLGSTRELKWKNLDSLRKAFKAAEEETRRRGLPGIELDTGKAMYDNFVERMRHSYAVILVSLGDMSPNMIFDAIGAGVPFIMTRETGIADQVKDAAVFIDPLDEKDIAQKIVWMADPANRAAQAEKVKKLSYTHAWEEIADEITGVWKRVRRT